MIRDLSADVAPLFVRLYDTHKIYSMAKDAAPESRAELTAAVLDLFNVRLSPREEELLCDVMIGLTRQAEIDLRKALSQRLAALETVPQRVILHFANDEIDVACPILSRSPVLTDLDLVYIIKSQGPEYWQAIAARCDLNPHVLDMLAETRDRGTAQVLAENLSIVLTEHAIEILAEIARHSDILAKPLLARKEIPTGIAARLFKHVGQELKEYIRTNYHLDFEAFEEAIDDIILEFSEPERTAFIPSAQAVAAAWAMKDKGQLSQENLLGTLKRGQISSFVAMFGVYTGMSIHFTLDVLRQKTGQGLAIACKARGFVRQDFVSIYLMTQRLRSKSRIVDQSDLVRALTYYNRLTPELAERLMHGAPKESTGVERDS